MWITGDKCLLSLFLCGFTGTLSFMQHYVFGYGSLFSKESRANTAHTPHASLATLLDFARSWCFEDPEGYCALGITQATNNAVNGVLVHVEPHQLPYFDVRETGYRRVDVTQQLATRELLEQGDTVWTYIIEHPALPCVCHPITQTYLDVVLVGCLEYGHASAREFMETTDGWERTLINDRDTPIFKRGLRTAPFNHIDSLLTEFGLCTEYSSPHARPE